jgi:glucose-1-phosphate cytidylyltransferase
MKAVILAGGLGSRLAEETDVKPKPMVEIGGRPILWHILKHLAHYGIKEFIIALGYKGEVVKRYFLDYASLRGSLTVDLVKGIRHLHEPAGEDWLIHLVDTGLETNTGGRIRRLEPWLGTETFMVTYGDGVCSVDLTALIRFHRAHGHLATLTAVRPPARFGGIVFDGDRVDQFTEKPQIGEGWINGGYLVLNPGIFEYLKDDSSSLEAHGMEQLAAKGELYAFRHDGFWQCMDTLRDKRLLEQLWETRHAPWQVWE